MKNNNQAIHFIITGGTIDSYYDGSKDTAVVNKESIIPQFIEGLKLDQKSTFTKVCMKDSRELTRDDLESILQAVKDSSHKKIVITHGTYTMTDTARFLEANLENNNRVIILTGSFIPINGFSFSDGPFQLGYAMAKTENLEKGVFICMNGKVLSANEAMKISKEGVFSSIFGGGVKF
ncbi:asparaginase [Patescibacteria group bacterium]|nr:asparaginase [Patescibacteria group bacterium]